MLRLRKYFVPYLLLILLNAALLFVRANADLSLPDYMSRIVNVGLQQGGIEESIPKAMRESTMRYLALFLTSEEQEAVQGLYERVDAGSTDYATYVEEYPALAEGAIYVLRPVDQETIDQLSPTMARAMLLVYAIEQVQAHPEQAAEIFGSMAGGFDLSKLPPGTDLLTLMARMPAEQRAKLGALIDQRFEAMGGEVALVKAAAQAIRAEYEALGVDVLAIQNAYILRIGGQMLLITLVSAAAMILSGLFAARVAAGVARDVRKAFFDKVMRFSGAELDRFSTASLITRSTNDITQIQNATMMLLRPALYAPIIGIGGVIRALDKSTSMWWTIGLAVFLLLILITTVFSIAVPKFKLIQQLVDRLNRVARENLTGMMVIRAFNRQDYEKERFDQANRDLANLNLFLNRIFVTVMPMMMILMNGLMILILWVGAHQVAEMNLQIGDMMAFMQYAMQIVFSFMMLSMLFVILPRADVAANRVAEVLEAEVSIRDPEEPKGFPEPFRGSIEFRHVSFRYPDAEEDVLHDIDLSIAPGETVGIIGTTGSGKSTLINLIPRFYDVTEGAIYIDGVDIREVRLKDLRDRIGYVPQKSDLFSGTVESNLRYADEEADEETMRTALEIAQAGDFILSRPEGLQAEVSQSGTNFSGGQKQRLGIARALVKRAPIYIFDDSFSALDYKTDTRLRRALREHLGESTVIIVSQRVATIKDADQIIVLDQGRVVCKGTHDELLARCPIYRGIAESQMKLQEVSA